MGFAMSRRELRRKKALAAANKAAYRGMAIGIAAGVLLFAVAFSVAPSISPEQLAATVKAQAVNLTLPVKAGSPSPQAPSSTAPRSPGIPVTPAGDESRSAANAKARYQPVGFDKLSSFRFIVTHQMVDGTKAAHSASLETLGQIPDDIKALNDQAVCIRGFMLPMKYQGNLTTDFLLLRNQSLCCYGVTPKISEWVVVRMAARAVKPVMDEPVAVCGILHVGDVRENGDLVGIYRLDGDRLGRPGE